MIFKKKCPPDILCLSLRAQFLCEKVVFGVKKTCFRVLKDSAELEDGVLVFYGSLLTGKNNTNHKIGVATEVSFVSVSAVLAFFSRCMIHYQLPY